MKARISHQLLVICAALSACGGAEPGSSPEAAVPAPSATDAVPLERHTSTAQSMQPPGTAAIPTAGAMPPPAPNSALPRATTAAASKLALSAALGMGAAAPSVTRQVMADRLESPTDLAVSSSGLVLVTERRRGLLLIQPGRAARVAFAPGDLDVSGGGGMLSVALDPDFAANRCVYVFMRSSRDGQPASRVVRLVLDEDLARVLERRDIVVVQDSVKASDRAPEANFGGALRFGPDGHLYVGLGDGRNPTAPQSMRLLDGKILRVDRNGSAATGSAPPAEGDPRVFASGLRDPVALAFPAEGRSILVVERRTDGRDTVLQLEQGENAGWDPRCRQQPANYCAGSDDQMSAGGYLARTPAWRAAKAGEGLSALVQFSGIDLPGWRRPMVVAYERAARLDLVQFGSQGAGARAVSALDGLGVGAKALAQNQRDLYLLTSGKPGGQEVWRLTLR